MFRYADIQSERRVQMRFDNQTFINRDIRLENNEYVGCTFERCMIWYNASGPVALQGNRFNECTWQFDGAAARTIKFMTDIYQTAPDLMETTFNNIRGR
jgi:hypothetical protein